MDSSVTTRTPGARLPEIKRATTLFIPRLVCGMCHGMGHKPLTVRDRRFIAEYKRHGIASRAYLAAGFSPSTRNALDVNAHRKLRQHKIKAEIARLERAMIKRADITLDKLLADLAADRELARRLDQPSAAIAATQLTAKLCGLLIERKETGNPGDFADARTEADVIAAVRSELGDAAANALQAIVSTDETALAEQEPASEAIN